MLKTFRKGGHFMRQYAQGDILFWEAEKLPDEGPNFSLMESRIIAKGEATGHAHVLEGNGLLFWRANDPTTNGLVNWLLAKENVEIEHRSDKPGDRGLHPPLKLPPGVYQIRQQRFYDYEAVLRRMRAERTVVD